MILVADIVRGFFLFVEKVVRGARGKVWWMISCMGNLRRSYNICPSVPESVYHSAKD